MAKRKPKPIFMKVGAPDWMATYSDMMSLLLTFFILLFSVSDVQTQKVYEVYQGFQQYFNLKIDDIGYYPKKITLSQIKGFLDRGVRPPSNHGNSGRTRAPRKSLEKIDRYASLVKDLNHHTIVVQGAVLFDRGSAEISEEAHPTLLKVAAWLRRTNMDIKIVGHTSSLPLEEGQEAVDHIELGFKRAMAVSRFLSGSEGDLSFIASQLKGALRIGANKIKNIPLDRITVASLGNRVSNPSRKSLWESPELDDRVEIMFLPRLNQD